MNPYFYSLQFLVFQADLEDEEFEITDLLIRLEDENNV